MEYVDGYELSDLLRGADDRKFDEPRAALYMEKIIKALNHVHA